MVRYGAVGFVGDREFWPTVLHLDFQGWWDLWLRKIRGEEPPRECENALKSRDRTGG